MVSPILVVEDELALIKYLKTALNQIGFSVKMLTREAEVIRTIEKLNPDLVLLKVNTSAAQIRADSSQVVAPCNVGSSPVLSSLHT